jgi:hypothetical protein
MIDQRQTLGLDPEKKVQIDTRVWFGQKLALWRSLVAWDIAFKRATEIIARCRHAEDCPGATDEQESCLESCPDRDNRLDALVILNAARQFAPISGSKLANQPYLPPSREYFSDVIAQLAACQAELEVLRGTVVTMPPPNDPPQLQEKSV